MPRSLGIFSLVASYFAVPGATIRTENHNPPLEDIAQAITDSLPRDGSAPMTGNLPMGNRKITGLANGTAAGDAAAFGQLSSLVVGPASAAADRIAVFDGVTGKLIKDGGKTVAEISSAIAVTDWDAIAASGFYYGLGTAANAPSAHHYSGFYSGDATNGTMIVGRAGLEMNFTRRKGGGFWGDWSTFDVQQIQSVWNTGTETTEGVISPAKLAGAIDAQAGPIPITAAGSGQWVLISSGSGVALVLPAGGTWAYFAARYSAGAQQTAIAGVTAGGTTIGGAVGGQYYNGFGWRIT